MKEENKQYWKDYHTSQHRIFNFTKVELEKARELLKRAEYVLVYDYWKEEKENPKIWEEDKPKRYKIKLPNKQKYIQGLRKIWRGQDVIFITTPHLSKDKDYMLIKKIWLFNKANQFIIKQQ